jgi:hypothetical protein
VIAGARVRYRELLDHPILRLELRRIRRKRWWPGRRFFMFYPALLGAALGYSLILGLCDSESVQVAALVTGVPLVCTVTVVNGLLSFALPWIAPALTAGSIVRERELGTLDLLRATLLTERAIVLGKLGGCLARLWPGILMLALLAPFQLVWVGASGGSSYLPLLTLDFTSVAQLPWTWLILTSVAGLLRPWADLALHAAVGTFVSVPARSSGVAVAIAYGAIIVIRVSLSLVTSLLSVAVMAIPGWGQGVSELVLNDVLMMPALMSLGQVSIEFIGAALLVWGAIEWLKRT